MAKDISVELHDERRIVSEPGWHYYVADSVEDAGCIEIGYREKTPEGTYADFARPFRIPANLSGALITALKHFADRQNE